MCYGKTKPADKKLSLLSLLSLKTTLSFRILSCVCFKDNRDNRDNLAVLSLLEGFLYN